METKEAIKLRRSVKQYESSYKIPTEEITELLTLESLSPTAFNIQHWRFVLVEDPDLRNEIRKVAWDQAQVTDSSLLIILCADLKAWEKSPDRYWKNASEAVQNFILPAIDGYYRDKDQVQRDEAMRSCGIAAQTIMLAAKSMGYDSCPMDGFDFPAVAQLINLPDDHVISMFVAVGKGLSEASPRAGQLTFDEIVIQNSF
ncbi:MAG: nitroreductase family protein [Methylococcaceae bacterium]|nr:nitroreductase family protein [Methylococcaceae bacterium]